LVWAAGSTRSTRSTTAAARTMTAVCGQDDAGLAGGGLDGLNRGQNGDAGIILGINFLVFDAVGDVRRDLGIPDPRRRPRSLLNPGSRPPADTFLNFCPGRHD
jgi:hypothetical protein